MSNQSKLITPENQYSWAFRFSTSCHWAYQRKPLTQLLIFRCGPEFVFGFQTRLRFTSYSNFSFFLFPQQLLIVSLWFPTSISSQTQGFHFQSLTQTDYPFFRFQIFRPAKGHFLVYFNRPIVSRKAAELFFYSKLDKWKLSATFFF